MKVTYYGYFGPTTNVRDASLDAPGLAAFVAAIAALPAPAQPAAGRNDTPCNALVARDPAGRPLRFISIEELTRG